MEYLYVVYQAAQPDVETVRKNIALCKTQRQADSLCFTLRMRAAIEWPMYEFGLYVEQIPFLMGKEDTKILSEDHPSTDSLWDGGVYAHIVVSSTWIRRNWTVHLALETADAMCSEFSRIRKEKDCPEVFYSEQVPLVPRFCLVDNVSLTDGALNFKFSGF